MSSGAFIVQRCLSVKLTHNSDFPVMPVERALWSLPALPGMQDLRCPGLSSNQTHSFNSQLRFLLVVERKPQDKGSAAACSSAIQRCRCGKQVLRGLPSPPVWRGWNKMLPFETSAKRERGRQAPSLRRLRAGEGLS